MKLSSTDSVTYTHRVQLKLFFFYFLDFQSTACAIEDFQCNSEASENFLEKTASGDVGLDIKPYDPFVIDSFTSHRVEGVVAKFKNINVTGLRKQNVTEFK